MATHNQESDTIAPGLDRAPLGTYRVLDNHSQQDGQATKDDAIATDSLHGPHKLRRLSQRLRVKISGKARGGSDAHNDQRFFDTRPLAPTLAPGPEAGRDSDRFFGDAPEKPNLLPVKALVTHPVDTIRSVAHRKGGNDFAENAANTEVSHGASVNLVLSHEKIAASTNDQDRLAATQGFELLKKERQDYLVRWTMDRHAQRVKNAQAQKIPRAEKKDFIRLDDGKKKMHWLDYGHHLLEFHLEKYGSPYIGASSELPEPTESALISSFERVLLTSVSTQNVIMKLRSIAFWERPGETAAYAVLYVFLLMFTKIISTIILFAILSTVKARFYPPTVPELRDKLERSEDTERVAQDLSELIEQHGAQGWVDAFIKQAGPTLQLHLEDLADSMEVLTNFHAWRDPWRTKRTLVALSSLWLVAVFTPTWLLVKGLFFFIGFAFFVLAPIGQRWPQYRLLVSPRTWLMWKIPTHGEWAIARLQAEAAQHLHDTPHAAQEEDANGLATIEEPFIGPIQDPKTTADEARRNTARRKTSTRIGRYHCLYEKLHGNLSLDTKGIYFELHLTADEKWRLKYAELKSMQKIVGSSMIGSGEDILFINMQDTKYRVSALKHRDEVFTQIIGYSGIEWRITA